MHRLIVRALSYKHSGRFCGRKRVKWKFKTPMHTFNRVRILYKNTLKFVDKYRLWNLVAWCLCWWFFFLVIYFICLRFLRSLSITSREPSNLRVKTILYVFPKDDLWLLYSRGFGVKAVGAGEKKTLSLQYCL